MTKEEYMQNMRAHIEEFRKLKVLMINDTISFTQDGVNTVGDAFYDLSPSFVREIDDITLFGAWIIDKLEGKITSPRNLSKKVQKTLGYNVK